MALALASDGGGLWVVCVLRLSGQSKSARIIRRGNKNVLPEFFSSSHDIMDGIYWPVKW